LGQRFEVLREADHIRRISLGKAVGNECVVSRIVLQRFSGSRQGRQ
jgi:hypothetical protein